MAAVVTLTPEADLLLRRFIIELADKVIASKVYAGPEFDLANWLSAAVYRTYPAHVREDLEALEKRNDT